MHCPPSIRYLTNLFYICRFHVFVAYAKLLIFVFFAMHNLIRCFFNYSFFFFLNDISLQWRQHLHLLEHYLSKWIIWHTQPTKSKLNRNNTSNCFELFSMNFFHSFNLSRCHTKKNQENSTKPQRHVNDVLVRFMHQSHLNYSSQRWMLFDLIY